MLNVKFIICLFLSVTVHLQSQVALNAPTGLTATWLEGSGNSRSIVLNWIDNTVGETSYSIEKKVGAGAWTNLAGATALGADTISYTDSTILRSVTTRTFYYYRVRSISYATKSGAAEVATVGIPSQWPSHNYDSDADGINDLAESEMGLSPTDWQDGTGDTDGDLIPDSWEHNLGTSVTTPNSPIVPHITVDASRTAADTATETKTITAAITKLGTTTTIPTPCRIILVKPGVYSEIINNTSTFQVAFIADRSGLNPRKECEIRGTTNGTVISTTGSAVFDGFVITRSEGTSGPAFESSESATPTTRTSTVRLVNCIVRNMDNGAGSVVEQNGGRLVLAHNTFFMNAASSTSLAHSYSSGVLGGTSLLQSTARLKVMNCIFWNPINTTIPEFYSIGDYSLQTNILYAQSIVGSANVNPGLTPKGYLTASNSAASTGGTTNVRVLRDMHGEIRFNPPGRGADDWNDQDTDQIPDFADSLPLEISNAGRDNDDDLLTELLEYQAGTSIESSSTNQALTLDQALRIFSLPIDYLTREEGDVRYMLLNPMTPQKVRVAPGGGIDMGEFD